MNSNVGDNMTNRKQDRLWIQLGKMNRYEDFRNIESLAEYLVDQGVVPMFVHRSPFEYDLPGYGGWNHVYLYWDNPHGSPWELTDNEISELAATIVMANKSESRKSA